MKNVSPFGILIVTLIFNLTLNTSKGQGVYFTLEVIDYESKKGIGDARVKIVGVDAQDTDRNGKVVFRLEEGNTFQVFVTTKGYKPVQTFIQTSLKAKTEDVIEMHKVVDDSYFIQGRVLDQNGIRVPNLQIQLQIGSFQEETYSDSISGYFIFKVPLERSGKFPEGLIHFNFKDCPQTIPFKPLPAGQNSEIMEINKSCKRTIKGQLLSPQKKLIKGSSMYYRTAEPNLSSLKEIQSEKGEFAIEGLEANRRVFIFFEHHQYEKKKEIIHVDLKQEKNYIKIQPDRLSLPKLPVKNNTPFYVSFSLCTVATIYGVERFISANNLHKDYKNTTDNDAFIAERHEYENRDEAYLKLEKMRKSSLIFFSAGILGGTIGYITLYRSKKTRFDFSLAGEIAVTYNINKP